MAKKKKKHKSFSDYTKSTLNLGNDDISPVVDKANPKTYNQKVNAFATYDDIAPVTVKKDERPSWLDGWFKKSEGNKQEAALGTTSDALLQATTGFVGAGETILDFLVSMGTSAHMTRQMQTKGYLTPEDYKTADQMRKDSAEFIKQDLYNEKEVAKKILAGVGSGASNYSASPTGFATMEDHQRAMQTKDDIKKYLDEEVQGHTVLGEKSQGVLQSAGHLGATALASAAGIPWWATTYASSYGGKMEEALNEGATYDEAMGSAFVTAGAEVLSEKLSGGISFGGKTLDEGLTNLLAKRIAPKGLRALAKIGMDFTGEGAEEVVSQFFDNLGSSLYKEENLGEILASEQAIDEYITSFISGGALGGASSGAKAVKSSVDGSDVLTGYSKNEQAVFDEVLKQRIKEKETGNKKLTKKEKDEIYEDVKSDFESGDIDIDTIESVLGGEKYKSYQSAVENEKSLKDEFTKLNQMKQMDMTGEQIDRRTELKEKLEELKKKSNTSQMKEQLSKEVFNMTVNDSVIQRSYEQDVKKKSDYTADLSKYDTKQKETIQRAIDSGILNDSRKTHEFVDLVAKLSAEKGVSFDFMNNERIKESGFAIEGMRTNGVLKEDGTVGINMESKKALNTVVGHEITHVLEGDPELYNALSEVAKEFGEAKGIYQSMYDAAYEGYKSVYELDKIGEEAYAKKIEKEVVADLVGDYVFSDINFVRKLSTQNRNVFQKIYDEIKYFVKSVSTRSDVGKKLLKLEKTFEEVYRESVNTPETTEGATDTKYSMTDSDGTQLTEEQQEYFKNSKVRDKNGDLKVMYHGSQESFTVFDKKKAKSSGLYGKGFYFTESKSHAQQYGSQYEVYLNITNPVQNGTKNITKDQLRNFVEALAENEDYGIENYGYGATVDSITEDVYGKDDFAMLMDLNVTCVGNMVEAIELFNEVNGTDYNGIVAPTETVAFYPNQIKKIDNQSPTSDSDIRFSLSKSVEETKDLVAVHNLRGTELMKTLELGGLPMPSIAVIKAKDGHEMYGDVTLILPKESIDPKLNYENKVYGGDAWTPTYPKIEYKPKEKVAKKIRDKYYDFAKLYGYDEARPLYRYVNELEDSLNRDGGEEALLEKLYDDTKLMQMFLQDSGKEKVQDVVKETVTKISEAEAEMNQYLIDALGNELVAGFEVPYGENPIKHRRMYMEEHEEEIRNSYEKLCKEVYDFTDEEVENVLDNTDRNELMKIMRGVYMYKKNNGVTVKTETDYEATKNAIKNAAEDGYKEWVDNLFKGIEEKSGIRNNAEVYTRNGNRISWNALHWENTLENVVKVMKQQDNGQAFFGGMGIWGVSAKEYGSIQEIRSDSGRLRKMSDEEYAEVKESYQNRLSDIAAKIMSKTERNQFIALDNAMECIVDSIRVSKNPKGLFKELKQYTQLNVTEKDANDIIALVKDIANMPTGYFEAKPQRAVGLDEVGVFVIPNNSDAKLKQELLNKGYSIAEYNPDIEGDRTRVVNEFEKYKFSLSDANQGKAPRRRGYYSEDVLLKRDTQESVDDIAPVSEDHLGDVNGMVQEKPQNDFVEDYAPLTEVEANVRDDRQIEDHYFPDDIPTEEPEEIYNGTYAEHVAPADPFYEKDIFEVGRDRKQKAYMYENPEVKPFFQEEARYMLGELDNSSKGERFYNDQLYYDTNGEYGIFGTKRHTSEEIAYLLDTFNYTYKDIAKGLNAIIEDNGKENNAISKRIEFLLDERLRLGYKDFWFGDRVPPNQEYINLLNEKQINEYNDESFSNWVQNLSEEDIRYFTQREEEIASVGEEYIAPQTPEQILYSLEENQDAKLEEADKKVDAIEEEDTPELSVDEQYSAKVDNYKTAIEGYNTSKAEIEKAFDDVISQKQSEYDGLKRKDTQRASNLLMQMENLRLRKANSLSKFDKRIENTQNRLDKMIAEEDAVKERMHGKRRKEAHAGIVNNIKSYFASKGLDLDTVLGDAKNLSTFSTVDNTPQRVMEKALGYKAGQALADMTVNKVALNESEGIKWVNGIVKELKQISKEYGIKPRSKESAAAQKFAEGYYVDKNDKVVPYKEEQLKAEFPDPLKRENIMKLASDPRIREIYDDAFDMINKSRRRNHYKEIPKRANYFLHSMEKSDIFSRLGTPFNPQDIGAADLPTDINGMTADFKPGQPYFASANARKGYKTTYDLLGGVEKYINSAKNQIYHIDDIQTLRALRNYIADMYGQAKGFEGLDEMSNVEVAERIEQIQSNHLSSFAKFLNEEANIIAGKTSLIDRGLEGIIGRRGIKVVETINRQVGSNMVGFNVSSSLTNLISGVQAMAKSNKFDVLKAFTQTVSNRIGSIYGKNDGFTEQNPGYIRRQGIDRFSSRPVEKINDAGYFLMGAVDNVTSEFILRTKYNELTRKGMSSEQAHIEADKWASRILGDRTIGQQPQLYNSKMLGLITKFQLEVRNQLDSQFYDTYQDAKATSDNHAKVAAKVGATVFQLAVLQNIFGKAFESVTGYNPAFDIIEVLMTAIGADDDEESEDTALDNVEQGFLALLEDLPYTSTLTGGRIPISSALPIKELVTGQNDYGQEKPRTETLGEIAPYYLLPTGYGQIKKTKAGLGMFDEDLPVKGSYTDSGNLRFPVEDTTKNRVQAGLFGQYANENARDYFDNERSPLKEKQIQEYSDLDLPIRDYWDYRDGLKNQKKLKDKFEYVNDQNVTDEQKNIMINNIVKRKEKVDMSNYDDFANYEEFDWYSKNTEKYNFLQENGVSYSEYKADKDTKEQYDSDYSIYKHNPEKVTMSKAITGEGKFLEYRGYMRELDAIRADKDSNGNSISGSAKAKKQDYIQGLNLDYGQKIILHRSLYDSKSDKYAYDRQIVEYLESRGDISQEEMYTILKELEIW